jgi:hypothetical protein
LNEFDAMMVVRIWGLMNQLQGSDWQMPVQLDITGRDTPLRNSIAEIAFAANADCGRAIMSAARVATNYRETL